ncbi:MAG: hypothetical protein LUB59_04750 [Candidatus Gastranaerophilales bacterium]|nr:hypothetical protein [Candidatus Gastranaerophilales bacterium]
MKKILSLFFSILISFAAFSPAFAVDKVKRNYYEIREMQTRVFETNNRILVMKAVINTLQDNGFIIQNIEDELGFIRAKKEVKLKRTNKKRATAYSAALTLDLMSYAVSFGTNAYALYNLCIDYKRLANEIDPHTVIFDSNVVIEPFGKNTKVRFSVIEKELENGDGYTIVKSSPRKVVRHYEADMYQEFFNQVGKNLFIEKI